MAVGINEFIALRDAGIRQRQSAAQMELLKFEKARLKREAEFQERLHPVLLEMFEKSRAQDADSLEAEVEIGREFEGLEEQYNAVLTPRQRQRARDDWRLLVEQGADPGAAFIRVIEAVGGGVVGGQLDEQLGGAGTDALESGLASLLEQEAAAQPSLADLEDLGRVFGRLPPAMTRQVLGGIGDRTLSADEVDALLDQLGPQAAARGLPILAPEPAGDPLLGLPAQPGIGLGFGQQRPEQSLDVYRSLNGGL